MWLIELLSQSFLARVIAAVILYFVVHEGIGNFWPSRRRKVERPDFLRPVVFVETIFGWFLILCCGLIAVAGLYQTPWGLVTCGIGLVLGAVWLLCIELLDHRNRRFRGLFLAFLVLRIGIPVIGLLLSAISIYVLFLSPAAKAYYAEPIHEV